MALTERLALLVTLDANGAIKGFNDIGKAADKNLSKADQKLDRMASRFQKAGAGMLAGAGLAGVALFKAGQSAAGLEQAVGGTEAVFKDASGTIERFAKDSAQNMGLSERAFREATTSIGGQLKGLGFSTDDAADKAVELTGVAADLAATYGGTTAEAVSALGAAFRGEADPAERFNLRLNQTTVNAKAVEMGLASSTSQVDAQAKAQATLALITEQSADAQGQFKRETDSASGAMQIANAEFENAKAALGESVAPIMADVATKLSGLATGFSDANEASGGLLSKLAAYGTVGLGAAGGISFAAGKVIELRKQIIGLPTGAKAAAAGVGLLGLVFFRASQRADELRAAAANLREEAERTGDSLEEVAKRQFVETITGSADAREALDLLGLSYEDLRVPLGASESEVEAWKRALLEQAEASGVAQGAVGALVTPVIKANRALAEAATVTSETTEAEKALGVETESLTEDTGGLTAAVKGTEEAYRGLIDAILGFADSDLSLRESIDKTEDALAELAEAEHAAAFAGGNNKEANEALEDALFNVEHALYDQAEAARKLAEETAALAGETDTAAAGDAAFRWELGLLRGTLEDGSPLAKSLDATILRLDAVATDRQATISITLRELYDAGQRQKSERFGAPGRATGGPVYARDTVLVGERGPELLTMGTAGWVTSNDALNNALRNTEGGTSMENTTNIYVAGSVDRDVLEEMVRKQKRIQVSMGTR